ncbi:trihelix transcription factor GTL1 [Argentina anserina]|uniref:trihelix transcription factor GTL1 n=1 Tax=Argentina anserina TaxID=57926 RepID=UPI002176410B|nr:trihelix transcription factor GTL1 [Potentilla anserina]
MEVLNTGGRNMPDPEAAAIAEEEFPAQISPFSETHQAVFDAAMTPQKLRIRCNGRSALPDDADPSAQLAPGMSPHNGIGEYFRAQDGEFLNWKRKRKRTSSKTSAIRKSKRLERLEHFLEGLVNKMMEKQEQMHQQLIEMVQDKEKERIAKEEAWKRQELERITRDEEVRAQDTSRSLALINFVQNLLGGHVQVPQPAPVVAQPLPSMPPSSNHDHQCVQVPQPAPIVAQPVASVPPSSNFNFGHQHVQVPQSTPVVSQPAALVPLGFNHGHQYAEQNDYLPKDTATVKGSATPSDKRWLPAEIQALIELRTSLEDRFHSPNNCGAKSLWEEIALGMNRMGYDRTGRKCKEKWENMNKYFRKAITVDKERPANAKTCQYFNELELLYKNGRLNLGKGFSPSSNLGNGSSCTDNLMEIKSEKESQQCVLSDTVDTRLLTCATMPSVLNSNEAAERTRVVVSPAL